MGWTGAAIPEEYGGAGLGHLGLCVLAEELGAALAPVPFSSSVYLASEAILAAGSAAQKKAWLPKLASGEIIGTLALAEGPGKADLRKLRATFRGGVLNGEKLPVPDGDVADVAVVVAQGERGIVLAIVDLKASGISRAAVETIDPSRSHARIAFDGTPAEALGAPGEGEALLRRVQDRAAVLFAFEQVGGAQRSLEMARDYALRALRLRPPHRLLPGHQAQAGRCLCRNRVGALERLLRRLGARAQCRGAAAGRRRRTHLGQRGLLPRGEREHPGAWRHGLHLGVRLPPATTAAPSCFRSRSAARRLWKDRLVTQLETANAPS